MDINGVMMNENWIECKECGIEFNAESPMHKDVGYYTVCIDCTEEAGIEDDKVKAFINITDEGDFGSISVVPKKFFEKVKDMEDTYKNE